MTWEDGDCTALTTFKFTKYKKHVEDMLRSKVVNKWEENDGWDAEVLQGAVATHDDPPGAMIHILIIFAYVAGPALAACVHRVFT